MILMQTKAMFIDAYRELNAKKLFWITMMLTVVFSLALATIGIDESGVSFLWFKIGFLPLNTDIITAKQFYLAAFSYLGIGIWLTWIATILAIISTSGIIPDLVTEGVIECMLAKPISRVRLFLTKYSTGLMFVALQVAAFSVVSMLVIWIRGGYLEPRILLAIPIVVCFYSFLYSVTAFIGLISKSTMTAMLITGLFWGMIFVINLGENIVITFEESTRLYVQEREERIDLARSNTIKLLERQNPADEEYEPSEDEILKMNPFLTNFQIELENDRKDLRTLGVWSSSIFAVKTILPKTAETIDLLNRNLIADDALMGDESEDEPIIDPQSDIDIDQSELNRNVTERFRERSIAWILGTSFLFEGVLLGLCCWIFARRDF